MKEFDKIIGYTSVKKELMRITDTLRNTEAYKEFGVSAPVGLMLHGEPGVGKSLMAACVIEASGRKCFTLRKNKPNGEFINYIKEIFLEAAENAPSIVFLDDMDKFANGDGRHKDEEEYVTVQACIDEIRGKGVFVLATANNMYNLPDSLLRPGRFDRHIRINTPRGKDAEDIIKYYLEGKKLADDIDYYTIARLLENYSCATLETVINEAGLYAGYERAKEISLK